MTTQPTLPGMFDTNATMSPADFHHAMDMRKNSILELSAIRDSHVLKRTALRLLIDLRDNVPAELTNDARKQQLFSAIQALVEFEATPEQRADFERRREGSWTRLPEPIAGPLVSKVAAAARELINPNAPDSGEWQKVVQRLDSMLFQHYRSIADTPMVMTDMVTPAVMVGEASSHGRVAPVGLRISHFQ